jgi:hypothetical protein
MSIEQKQAFLFSTVNKLNKIRKNRQIEIKTSLGKFPNFVAKLN